MAFTVQRIEHATRAVALPFVPRRGSVMRGGAATTIGRVAVPAPPRKSLTDTCAVNVPPAV